MDASYLSYDSSYCVKKIKTKCKPRPEETVYIEIANSVLQFC
jgi:hypothetical protein